MPSRRRQTSRSHHDRHPTRARPTPRPTHPTPATPEAAVGRDGDRPVGRFAQALATAQAEALTATFWAADGLPAGETAATVTIRGRRTGIAARPHAGDQFVHQEIIDDLAAQGGPLSLTAQITDINPGDWVVTAEMTPGRAHPHGRSRPVAGPARPLDQALWSCRRWQLSSAPPAPLHTTVAAFAPRPGIIPGIWPAMVSVGVITALALQAPLDAHAHLSFGSAVAVSGLATLAGALGAKSWYVALERREHRWDGWCIQGFVLAAIGAVALAAPALGLRLGVFLDHLTPALFVGMAVGRIGCFFAGCCTGRPTRSRWGVWSSDRRVGTRRIPTQLLESALAFDVAAASVIVVLAHHHDVAGLVLLAALAAYTLGRQGLLKLRAEPRRTTVGTRCTAAAAALVLAAAVAGLTLI